MRVVAIVLSWNAAAATLACLESLHQQSMPVEIVVVDNASRDDTIAQITQRYPDVRLIRNERNLGFAGGMNIGIRTVLAESSPPDAVILLNQDTVLDPTCIEQLVAPLAADEQVAAVGAKIRYPDGTIQHAGVRLEWPRAVVQHIGWHEPDTGQYDQLQECEFVTGAAIALRSKVLDAVQTFDEGFVPAYFEDIDLCARLRWAGWKIVYNPAATLVHHESLSLRDELQRSSYYNRGRLRFVLKHYTLSDLFESFFPAECAHAERHALWPVEGRALRWAYAETLLHLREILAARRQLDPTFQPADEAQLIEFMRCLQRAQARAFWQNAHRRADWMFNHS
ncbi:glycosyltransferase family 2 protein [Chloroflexus sp.]|uniref:glycosyltransferase family 2 protein n=1 Tax=Chloroflexus sp. TaxID=1904827 RepID=UPI002ACEFFBF|nr:glycosyltransferase family 2 protein [Chloroflexus sp.]